jgi:hypothetical protein
MGGHGVVIHADENQLRRNIFPFPSNVKGDYMLHIPKAVNQTHFSTKYTKGHEGKPKTLLPFFM